MRLVIAALALIVPAGAYAANAPFVQITGTPSKLASTCSTGGTAPGFGVNIDIPAGSSYGVVISYLVFPPPVVDPYSMLTTYLDPYPVPLYQPPVQNGPVAGAGASYPVSTTSAWYASGQGLAGSTLLNATFTAYSGSNGAGTIASTASLIWDCTTGAVISSSNSGNADGAIPQSLSKTRAVEFYHASLDHYFVSTDAAEIAALDSGQTTGWARTGLGIDAFAGKATGASPVCRFYIPPGLGNSHFYSASPSECAAVQAQFPAFSYESAAVFYVDLPNTTTGACPPLTAPVYRLWNQRSDSNHRYTIDPAVKAQMIAKGYVAEGYGPDAVIMCYPL